MLNGQSSGKNAHGHGPHKMVSTADLSSVPTGTVSSFPPPVTGTARVSTMPVPAAATGLRLSIRSVRASRGMFSSVPTMSAGATTTVSTGDLSVPFQNKVGQGVSQLDNGLPCADRIKVSNLGRSPH